VPRSERLANGTPIALIEREPLLQLEIGQRFREIMSADIRRLEHAHGALPQGKLRRISTPAAVCYAPTERLSTGNRYFWQVSVNTLGGRLKSSDEEPSLPRPLQ